MRPTRKVFRSTACASVSNQSRKDIYALLLPEPRLRVNPLRHSGHMESVHAGRHLCDSAAWCNGARCHSLVESPVLMEQTWQRQRVSLLWRDARPAAIHDG